MSRIEVSVGFRFAIVSLLVASSQVTPAQQSAGDATGAAANSCHITVMGAVQKPGVVDALPRTRLVDVIALARGPNERAGATVQVVHRCGCSPCDRTPRSVDEYRLVDVLRGLEKGNPYVGPGDIVIVVETDLVFFPGNISTGGPIRFVKGMTVTRAIALAGGVMKRSELITVRIHHNSSDTQPVDPIRINLRTIVKGRAEDLLLQPWDIVEISDEKGQFLPVRPVKMPPHFFDPPLKPRKDNSC